MRKVVAIVQARTSSSRLPGKVLAPIGGCTMVERLLGQLRGCTAIDQVVVATSVDPSDDALADHLRSGGVPVFRGDLGDVLGRFGAAAAQHGADVVVRLTGDCPLHTPDTVDEVITEFLRTDVDYATNTEPYTRPDGLDVEVFTRAALEEAVAHAEPGPDREHVTPYIRRAPHARRMYALHRDRLQGAGLRWTVDDADDLEYVRRVWACLDESGPGPHSYEVVMRAAEGLGEHRFSEVGKVGLYKSVYDAAAGTKAPPLARTRREARLAGAERASGGVRTRAAALRGCLGAAPVIIERGRGARVWDADGNEYIDLRQRPSFSILGHAEPSVDRAAHEQASRGRGFPGPHPLEVELVERMTRLVPCAEAVRFERSGTGATRSAVRAAVAHTGRTRVATRRPDDPCGRVPGKRRLRGSGGEAYWPTHPFPYNDVEALDRVLSAHPGEFAAVLMEPLTFTSPARGYLQAVKDTAHRHGALLIYDETRSGFRFGLGGAQATCGTAPDLASFGESIGNGYAIGCVAGRDDVVRATSDAGSCAAVDLSGVAAAVAVLDALEHTDAFARMRAAARRLTDGVIGLAKLAGLASRVAADGQPVWLRLRFLDGAGGTDELLRAVWAQEVAKRGVLIDSTHNVSAAFDYADVDHVLRAYAEAFKYIGGLVRRGEDLAACLDGLVVAPTADAPPDLSMFTRSPARRVQA